MFTIEHQFDATVITLIDEGDAPLAQDVIVEAYEDCVVIEQLDEQALSAQRQSYLRKSLIWQRQPRLKRIAQPL